MGTAGLPTRMAAMCLMGHGGLEQLRYRCDVPVPVCGPGQVLLKVTATAKNNTDRKAREGLYPTRDPEERISFQVGGTPTLRFPRIQGADTVGRIVAVGSGVDAGRIGQRCLVDFNLYPDAADDLNLVPDYLGHGADGGFAEYVVVAAAQAHAVDRSDLADAELAALGLCSYQTALHMLTVAGVSAGEQVLVTGASGGVGTALIQLCRLLGAIPHALSRPEAAAGLRALGAETVLDRSDPDTLLAQVQAATAGRPIDAVMDLLGGTWTDRCIDTMIFDMRARRTYPRLSIAGASAGNVSRLLWTRIYLYQVQVYGVSHGTRNEALRLIDWIRAGALQPVLHGTWPLSRLHDAERQFVEREADFLGKLVIVPDSEWAAHGQPFALGAPL